MDEYIDIVTKTGKFTGKSCLKSEAHNNGYYHNTAHIWLYTKNGEILLSQRSAAKVIYPLLWDISVAGHVDARETIEQAAIRETQEEIGLLLTEKDLKKIGVFECFQKYKCGIIDNEFHHTFITELKVDISELKLQKNEVEAVKLVSINQFKELLKNSKNSNHFVHTYNAYYEFVLDVIRQKIK